MCNLQPTTTNVPHCPQKNHNPNEILNPNDQYTHAWMRTMICQDQDVVSFQNPSNEFGFHSAPKDKTSTGTTKEWRS